MALTAIAMGYEWRPGPQSAECPGGTHHAAPIDAPGWDWDTDDPSRLPSVDCGCGFWGYKNYRQLLRGHGSPGYVLGLIEQWGKMVPAETGARSEFAEIVAIIKPVWTGSKFPRALQKGLHKNYPDVPIVSLGEVSGIIKDRGLTLLKLEPPPPLVQWIDPSGDLVWMPDRRGTDYGQAIRLPVAASHPDQTLPEYRLVKASFRDEGDRLYAYWRRDDGDPTSKREDRGRFYEVLQSGRSMDLHLVG